MAGSPGFQAALDRKYDILQDEAANRGALEQAQAANITAGTPFENALKAAQTRQENATASTVNPLAQASIAATQAGIGETGARAKLYGAQTGLVGAQTQEESSPLLGAGGAGYFADQHVAVTGRQFTPSPTPLAGATTSTGTSIVPPGPVTSGLGTPGLKKIAPQGGSYDENGNYVYQFAKGTAKVPGKPVGGAPDFAGMLQAAKGSNKVPGRGGAPTVDSVNAKLVPGEAVVNVAGIKHIPGGRKTIAKANAKGAKEMGLGMPTKGKGKFAAAPPARAKPHFAMGTDSVGGPPAPGQTITSGTWGPPPPPSPAPPSPLGQNTGLRLQMGYGKPRA